MDMLREEYFTQRGIADGLPGLAPSPPPDS